MFFSSAGRVMFRTLSGKITEMKSLRESDIEKYLTKVVKNYGGEVRKVKWVGRDGAPDRVVMLPPQPMHTTEISCGLEVKWKRLIPSDRTFWVETKPPGGKATFPKDAHERKQHREHERMRKMGQRVEVVDSYQGIDDLFN